MKKIILLLCTLLMVFGFTFTSYASEVPSGYYDYNGHVLPYLPNDLPSGYWLIAGPDQNGYYYLYVTDVPFVYSGGQVINSYDGEYISYRYDGAFFGDITQDIWYPQFTDEFNGFYIDTPYVVWTSDTIRDTNGYVFMEGDDFFLPMAVKAMKVSEETLTETTMPQIAETMVLLMGCGVGLMALLMALPLLKNKFSHFLP